MSTPTTLLPFQPASNYRPARGGLLPGALRFGLPQLCPPQSTDQPLNTASLVANGAALSLQPHETATENVATALRKLLHEPTYRAGPPA